MNPLPTENTEPVQEPRWMGRISWVLVLVVVAGTAVAYYRWMAELNPLDRQVAIWVTVVGAMTNTACALLGCYLVLRKMSLLGDALSHAVLPGLVIAFMLAGSVNIAVMFGGALAAGMVTTFLVQALNRRAKVAADTSMGVVFTSMFAIGLILLKRYTGGDIDLDPDCVFLGALDFVGIAGQPGFKAFGVLWPRTFVSIAPVLLANVIFIGLFWKELKVSSFDPALATSMGFRAGLMHYLLMMMVAVTTVASFEAVGSILVVAMLIVPAATAQLLTVRLHWMLWIAAGLSIAASILARWASYRLNVNTPGMMALMVGLFYVAAVFLSPTFGVVGKVFRNVSLSLRIVREDILAMLYRLEELSAGNTLEPAEAITAVGGGWRPRLGLLLLRRAGMVRQLPAGLQLTDAGRKFASQLIRSHRLWESFLVKRLNLPLDHVHDPAMRMEHYIGRTLGDRLAEDLQDTAKDPHHRSGVRPASVRFFSATHSIASSRSRNTRISMSGCSRWAW